MSIGERIGLGAACAVWEAMWLLCLVMQIEFFNAPPPLGQGEDLYGMVELQHWLNTFPHWTAFIPWTLVVVAGLLWMLSEHGSDFRKLSAVAFGGTVTVTTTGLMSSATLPVWVTSTLGLILITGMASAPGWIWLAMRKEET